MQAVVAGVEEFACDVHVCQAEQMEEVIRRVNATAWRSHRARQLHGGSLWGRTGATSHTLDRPAKRQQIAVSADSPSLVYSQEEGCQPSRQEAVAERFHRADYFTEEGVPVVEVVAVASIVRLVEFEEEAPRGAVSLRDRFLQVRSLQRIICSSTASCSHVVRVRSPGIIIALPLPSSLTYGHL